MKMIEGVEVKLQAFIISALDGGECLPSHLLDRFTPGQGTVITIGIGACVRTRVSLDAVKRRERSPSARHFIPIPPLSILYFGHNKKIHL
jgi:hypothetical protein